MKIIVRGYRNSSDENAVATRLIEGSYEECSEAAQEFADSYDFQAIGMVCLSR